MKLISRTSDRTLMRKHNEPHSQPWGPWELCEGTEGLTYSELVALVNSWCTGEVVQWVSSHVCHVRDPYGRTQYHIVEDSF